MAELISVRRGQQKKSEHQGRPLAPLMSNLGPALRSSDALWCGDFSTQGYGFGHVKVLRQPPLPGTFGFRGDTLQFLVVCDGFHRGALADRNFKIWFIAGSGGLSSLDPGADDAATWVHGELDVFTRQAYNWAYLGSTGRVPELQVASLKIELAELEALIKDKKGLELFFAVDGPRGQGYVNLDGLSGSNFVIAAEFFS